LKDEEAIDWRGGFRSFHWARGISSKKGHGGFTKGKGSLLGWEKVLFMREMCARIKHGRISMTKPLEFYFK
jgi:hypothetical protein